MNFILRN